MKALILLITTLFLGAFAVANDVPIPGPTPIPSPHPMGYWELVMTADEKTETPDGFEIMQERHPDLFGNLDCAEIESASVSTDFFVYRGPHSCMPGDPALRLERKSYTWCEASHGGQGGVCVGSASYPLDPTDPCLGSIDLPPPPPPVDPLPPVEPN